MKERGIINDCPICELEGRQGECPHSEMARLSARLKLHGISLCTANEALDDLMRLEIPIPRPAALALLEMANGRIRREIAVMEALEAKIAAIGGQQADNIH